MTDDEIKRWARQYYLVHTLQGKKRGEKADTDWLAERVPAYEDRSLIYAERDRIRARRER